MTTWKSTRNVNHIILEIKTFAENIEKWYEAATEKKKGVIDEDDDFIEIDASPNRFEPMSHTKQSFDFT